MTRMLQILIISIYKHSFVTVGIQANCSYSLAIPLHYFLNLYAVFNIL